MRQSTQGQAQIDEHPRQTATKVKVSVSTRDDFLGSIDPIEMSSLLGRAKGKGVDEGFTERVP